MSRWLTFEGPRPSMHLVLVAGIATTVLEQAGWPGVAEVVWFAGVMRVLYCFRHSVAVNAFRGPDAQRAERNAVGFSQAGAADPRAILNRHAVTTTTSAA